MRLTPPPERPSHSEDAAEGAVLPSGDAEGSLHKTARTAREPIGSISAWWGSPVKRSEEGVDATPRSPAETFEDRSQPVADVLDHATRWLAVILPVYVTIRIFRLAGFEPILAMEIVRQQGISGIAEAVLASLFNEIAGLVVLGGLVLALRPRTPPQLRMLGWVLAGVAILFAPLLILVLVLIAVAALALGSVWWWRGTAVLVVASTIVIPLISAVWLPHERVSRVEAPGVQPSGCYIDGYVLGRSSGTFYSVMQAPASRGSRAPEECRIEAQEAGAARQVYLLPDVTARQVCKPDGPGPTWQEVLAFVQGSLVDKLSRGLEKCRYVPPDPPAPQGLVTGRELRRALPSLPPVPEEPCRRE